MDNLDPVTGRYEQFAGYDELEPLLIADVGTPPVPADIVLGHQRVRSTQIIKQADVLMAHHLIPEGVAVGSLATNLDHYLPRTAHGSSLSAGVHAALLARVGRPEEALDLFRMAASIDFADLSGNEDGGLHMANLGGIWQAAVNGFSGLSVSSPDDRCLAVSPCLPSAWDEVRVRVRWRGTPLRLICRNDAVYAESDRPLHARRPRRAGPDRARGSLDRMKGRRRHRSRPARVPRLAVRPRRRPHTDGQGPRRGVEGDIRPAPRRRGDDATVRSGR